MKQKTRDQISEEYTWKLADLYTNEDAWQADFDKSGAAIKKLKTWQGKLGESAANLRQCLEDMAALEQLIGKLYVYAHLKLYEDAANNKAQTMAGKAKSLEIKGAAAASFIEPELVNIPEATLTAYMEKEEGLGLYRHYLDNLLREKAHVLTPEQEELLAGAAELSQAPSDIYSMLTNADMVFGEIINEDGVKEELTQGKYLTFLESKNREVRRQAFEAMQGAFEKQKHTMAAAMNANVNGNLFFSRSRNYPSALNMFLSSGNIPPTVLYGFYWTLSHKGLPSLHKYVALRKEKLGLDEIHIYDLYTPVSDYHPAPVTYEEAQKTILASLQPLGEDYCSVVREGFANRWIDVYENKGKRSGAFSWGAYGCHPYMLLNYNNTLKDMFTLTHEMGHSMHSYYSWEKQPFVYSSYTIFLGEIASTVNECLLTEYLLDQSGKEDFTQYLLNQYLEQFRTTVFRQAMFAEFELKIHREAEQGNPLTAESLNSIYRELNQLYYGPDIVLDPVSDIEWARIPHFYNSFYVYQYATGFSAAVAFTQKIRKEGAGVVKAYREFLAAGSSEYSTDIIKKAGVDLTSPKPVEQAMEVFAQTLEKI